MGIAASSLAAGVAAGGQNTTFVPSATVLARKILVMGSPLAAKIASVTLAVPQLIISPQDAINRYGAGSMLARLITQVFAATNYQVPVYAFPEADGTTAATGTFTIAGTPTAAGTLTVYVAGVAYAISVATTDTPTTIGANLVAALAADANCPVTAVNAAGVVTCTAKSKGLYGNGISLAVNAWPQNGDALPAGVTCAVVAMASGAGTPTVATDLNGLGVGSNQNNLWFTDVVHGYMEDVTTLAAISTYNGLANGYTGNYDRIVGRPFRCFTGDVAPGSAGLTALLALTAANTSDRTNIVIAVPGSLTHPSEIAAVACGVCAKINANAAEQNYLGQALPGVDPGNIIGLAGNDWTDQYANRNTAVSNGISPTTGTGSTVYLQNVVTFYDPSTVPATSNAYREAVNISKLQNIFNSIAVNFASPKWTGYNIVKNTKNVTASASRLIARDIDSVIEDYVALAKSWEKNGWIYTADFTISALKAGGCVTPRTGGDGFASNIPIILSGVGNIIDTNVMYDISLAAVS
jgi:phage tail sheath gpL-like